MVRECVCVYSIQLAQNRVQCYALISVKDTRKFPFKFCACPWQ